MRTNATSSSTYLKKHYNNDARKYYAQNYNETTYSPQVIRQSYIEEFINMTNIKKTSKILDVGCGPGELLKSLKNKRCELHGVDISESMIDIAHQNLISNRKYGVCLSVGDITDLKYEDEYFDIVIAAGVVEYQDDFDKSISELIRVLKPGGVLIFNVTNKYGYIHCIYPISYFLKNFILTKNIAQFVKKYVFRKGDLANIPKRNTHSANFINKKMKKANMNIIDFKFFHFSVLPSPICLLLGRLNDMSGLWLENRLNGRNISRFLAGGYLVCLSKDDKAN